MTRWHKALEPFFGLVPSRFVYKPCSGQHRSRLRHNLFTTPSTCGQATPGYIPRILYTCRLGCLPPLRRSRLLIRGGVIELMDAVCKSNPLIHKVQRTISTPHAPAISKSQKHCRNHPAPQHSRTREPIRYFEPQETEGLSRIPSTLLVKFSDLAIQGGSEYVHGWYVRSSQSAGTHLYPVYFPNTDIVFDPVGIGASATHNLETVNSKDALHNGHEVMGTITRLGCIVSSTNRNIVL